MQKDNTKEVEALDIIKVDKPPMSMYNGKQGAKT